jgi:hypothetical protein
LPKKKNIYIEALAPVPVKVSVSKSEQRIKAFFKRFKNFYQIIQNFSFCPLTLKTLFIGLLYF